MEVVIHQHPDCGTSCNVLRIIRAAGYAPTMIDDLTKGWTRPHLLALFAAAGLTPRIALRATKSPAAELGLLDASVPDNTALSALLEHPVLINRPLVCTARAVRLCRPSESVPDLLDRLPPGPWHKEDGTMIPNAEDHRL